jgi:hypothetical protein
MKETRIYTSLTATHLSFALFIVQQYTKDKSGMKNLTSYIRLGFRVFRAFLHHHSSLSLCLTISFLLLLLIYAKKKKKSDYTY